MFVAETLGAICQRWSLVWDGTISILMTQLFSAERAAELEGRKPAVRLIVMKTSTDVRGPCRMSPNDFGDPLTSSWSHYDADV